MGKVVNIKARKRQVTPEILHTVEAVDGRVEIEWTFPDKTRIRDFFGPEGAMAFSEEVREAALDAGAKNPNDAIQVPPILESRIETALEEFARRVGEHTEEARAAFASAIIKRGLESLEKELGIK